MNENLYISISDALIWIINNVKVTESMKKNFLSKNRICVLRCLFIKLIFNNTFSSLIGTNEKLNKYKKININDCNKDNINIYDNKIQLSDCVFLDVKLLKSELINYFNNSDKYIIKNVSNKIKAGYMRKIKMYNRQELYIDRAYYFLKKKYANYSKRKISEMIRKHMAKICIKEKYKRIGETPLFNFEESDYVYRYILKISKYSVF